MPGDKLVTKWWWHCCLDHLALMINTGCLLLLKLFLAFLAFLAVAGILNALFVVASGIWIGLRSQYVADDRVIHTCCDNSFEFLFFGNRLHIFFRMLIVLFYNPLLGLIVMTGACIYAAIRQFWRGRSEVIRPQLDFVAPKAKYRSVIRMANYANGTFLLAVARYIWAFIKYLPYYIVEQVRDWFAIIWHFPCRGQLLTALSPVVFEVLERRRMNLNEWIALDDLPEIEPQADILEDFGIAEFREADDARIMVKLTDGWVNYAASQVSTGSMA